MPLIAPKALQGLYFFCEQLAEGSFGVLYVAIHAITRQKVAIKILDKRKLGTDAYRVRSEIEALKQLNHKFIYKLYQVVETQSYFYLVVEYLPGGELFDYILQKEHLSEVEARVIFRQIVSAIGYVHSKGFAHRDLKPENILLDNDQNVRIIDFGLCAKTIDVTMLNTFCGSFAYAAPEVLANKEYSGSAADLWSLGVILYALLCGCLPFDPSKPEELPQKIGKGMFAVPDSLSKSSKHLLCQLMCVDPKKRIKIEELRRHPWIVEGFMGHPVDIDEEKVPMSPLNMHIVSEMTAYTRIPKVELARMLQQRSYDYLMATYMIMESALEEEDIFIRLQRRNNIVQNPGIVHTSHLTPSRSVQEQRIATSVPTSTPMHHSLSPVDTLPVCPSPLSQLPLNNNLSRNLIPVNLNNETNGFNTVNSLDDKPHQTDIDHYIQNSPKGHMNIPRVTFYPNGIENRPPEQTHKDKHENNKNPTPVRITLSDKDKCDLNPDHSTLSPSRSVDSQLQHLNHELYNTHLINKPLPVSATGNFENNLSATYLTLSSDIQHEVASLHSNPSVIDDLSRSHSSTDECANGSGRVIGAGATSWRHFGRLKKAWTPKKPMPDGRLVVERLRKARHLNNVLLLRRDLSPGQVFDRIASALRQQSIRFTLKGSGFLCVFANDWGKTVLSFELELVYVSARTVEASSSIRRRLTLKPRGTTVSTSPSRSLKTTHVGDSTNGLIINAISSKSSKTSNQSVDSSHESNSLNRLLGIKMKRIRGDAFMYTSLCRTILDLADVRQDNSN